MEVKEEWRKWDGQVTENSTAESFRDVTFSRGGMKCSRRELSVVLDGKLSRREQAVADAESCQDANIPSEVHPANRSSISDESDSMSRPIGLKKLKKYENVKKLKKPEKS